LNKFGGAPSESQGTVLNRGGMDFEGLSSNGSSMFIRGPGTQDKFMDESSAGGSVMQRINDDDQESYMGLANDQEDIDDKSAHFDSDKGLSKVATDNGQDHG